MNRIKLYIMISMILILIITFIGERGELVENLEIPVGMGNDIESNSDNTTFSVPISVYSFEENNISSYVINGKGKNIPETRENRQLEAGKKSLIGLNRITIFSEAAARHGLKNFIDILINNPEINDRALCAICEGKAEDILKYKEKGYLSSSEFIEGMIKNLKQYNFFPLQYSIMDIIVRMDAEGRNVLLPYITIKDKGMETTGLAIFKGYKMVAKSNINEAKMINILKESNVKGILTLQKDSEKYISCYATSKRKVKCYKEGNKYRFIINLDIEGELVSNGLYKDVTSDAKELKKYEEDMKNNLEKQCNDSINKIKYEYKVDVLDLGRNAVAKYGRGTGVDWNTIICDSDIKVNVKFKVNTEGRGDY